jgi:hypothetical protein
MAEGKAALAARRSAETGFTSKRLKFIVVLLGCQKVEGSCAKKIPGARSKKVPGRSFIGLDMGDVN